MSCRRLPERYRYHCCLLSRQTGNHCGWQFRWRMSALLSIALTINASLLCFFPPVRFHVLFGGRVALEANTSTKLPRHQEFRERRGEGAARPADDAELCHRPRWGDHDQHRPLGFEEVGGETQKNLGKKPCLPTIVATGSTGSYRLPFAGMNATFKMSLLISKGNQFHYWTYFLICYGGAKKQTEALAMPPELFLLQQK